MESAKKLTHAKLKILLSKYSLLRLFSLASWASGLGECVQRMNILVLAVLLIRDEIEVSFEVRFRCFVPTDQEALFPPHRELSPR